MRPPCNICGTPARFLLKKDGFDEYKCPKCGLSFVYPQPKAEWLKEKVYSAESGYQGNKGSDLAAYPLEHRTKTVLDMLVKQKPKGVLLDVGCSNGQFMFFAKQRGFTCAGIEINKRTADIARTNGFYVYGGFVENAPFDKEVFDIVYLGDVIEHVNNPRAFLEACASFLKPDGVLAISTPNVDCFWSNSTLRLYRAFHIPWSSLTPPHHLFQFSAGNLDVLAGEKGFKKIGAIFNRPPSLKYELGSLHLWKRYKERRTVGSFLFMIFSFALYVLIYALNMLFKPFLRKDFRMIQFYRRPISKVPASV